jgi:hypothetical protein
MARTLHGKAHAAILLLAAFSSVFLTTSVLLWPQRAWAVGEQNARLQGKIVEPRTNVPMPGAKVELRSADMIGGPRRAVTDDEGRFDFPLIPPGHYLLTVSYEGIKPIKRSVTLEVGQTEQLQIPLVAELAGSETSVIVEERRRLDSDRVSTGKVLTAEQESQLATTRRYQDVVQQLPGVTGGLNPVMAGGSYRHNRYLVDGLDITDPVDNTFSANFNFDAIAQMDLLLLAVDAQYNSLGGVINLITRRGTDRFNVDASIFVNHQDLSLGATAGTQLYEDKLLDQSGPVPPAASYQANLNIGGPIVKQKLWYYASLQYWYRLQSVVPGEPLNDQHPPLERHDVYARLKLTWAPAPRHRIELSFNADPAWISNVRNLAPANGNTNSYAPESEFYQNQGGVFGILNYDWFIHDNLIFSVSTGLQEFNLINGPQNGDFISSAHFDQASTITWNAADAATINDDHRWRFQFDPTMTWVKKGWFGQHTFKVGVQFQYLRHYILTGTPGNSTYTDNTNQMGDNGVLMRDPSSQTRPVGCNVLQPNPVMGSSATPCYQLTYYEPQRAEVQHGEAAGFFAQDIWKPTDWLTLVPGIRIDYGTAQNSIGQVVQNLLGFGPRIGASIDLTHNGKTLLKAAYGRSNEVSTLLVANAADVGGSQSTWQYNRADGRFDSFVTSSGGPNGYDLRGRCPDGTVTIACGNAKLSLTPPRADFFTVSLEREVARNVAASITYTYRLINFLWEDIELNARRTLDGGSIASFGDPRYGSILAYRPTEDAFRRYNGLDFVISGTPTPRWRFFVGYTLSFLDGTDDDQLSTFMNDPPRSFHFYGYLSDDHRHQIKANGAYSFHGLTLGANLTYMSGAPATRLYLTPLGYVGRYAWRGVDPGADPNDVTKWTELRSPDIFDVDIRVQYDLYELIHQHLSFIADFFNAMNLSSPTANQMGNSANQAGFDANNGAVYGAVTDRQVPFRVQLGARYQY